MSKDTFQRNNFAIDGAPQSGPPNSLCYSIYDNRFLGDPLLGVHIEPVMVIDSRDRNKVKWPNSNRFEINLKTIYKDVAKVELKFAAIPNTGYIINKYCNMFYFQDTKEQVKTCTYYTVELPCGNWPPENLEGPSIQSILESGMNEISKSSKYSVTYCKYTRKFTFKQLKGTQIFNLLFRGGFKKVGQTGTITKLVPGVDRFLLPEQPVGDLEPYYTPCSVGKVIGFSPCNLCDCLSYTSDLTLNLDRDGYVIVRIPGFERIDCNGDARQGAFCIIAATRVSDDFFFARTDTDPINTETYTKYFNPPLPELQKIRIEFLNAEGELFDFNGHETLMIFDVHSLTQQTTFPAL